MNETSKLILAGTIVGASILTAILALAIDLAPILVLLGEGLSHIKG
jgi:hypothetical protein